MEAELGRKLGVYAIDWIYLAIHFLFAGMVLTVIIPNNSSFDVVAPFALAWLVVYFVSVLVLRQMRPRFHLYENGLLVLHKGEKTIWMWNELTHFEGKRHTTYANGFAVWKQGANQFFADKTPAFRVGALTGHADVLVSFILSHIAQRSVPALEAYVRKGNTVKLGNVNLSLETISQYRWEQIKSLNFDSEGRDASGFTLKASVEGQFFSQVLGHVGGIEAYSLMGLIDAMRGTKYLHSYQSDTPFIWRRWWNFWKNTGWKLALIFGGFLFVVYMLSFFVERP